jgi:hypothetical protein
VARIVVASYAACYPVGGFLSWTLNWLLGFHRLGHDVHLVEKSGSWRNGCFDLPKGIMSDDCSFGIETVKALLARHGLEDRFCFVNWNGDFYCRTGEEMREVFRSADLFVDLAGSLAHPVHESWIGEAAETGVRVCVDGEPGYAQMKLELNIAAGLQVPQYDYYYTVGGNVGTARSTAPTVGKQWRGTFDPVNVDLFPMVPAPTDAPFTTVMAWQSHRPVEYKGRTYGQKDVEFVKFIDLPQRTSTELEIAVGGNNVPRERLRDVGWRVRDSHAVTATYDAFGDYIRASRGEFAVCKNVFVATNTAWFSDRSAAYLASGRPVVMQETGFSDYLPCGRGLFAVKTAEEAAAAIDAIQSKYEEQSQAAREIAATHLSATTVVGKILADIGI